jgi:hypothetical protein
MYADFLSLGYPWSFTQEHITCCRERIALSIMQRRAVNTERVIYVFYTSTFRLAIIVVTPLHETSTCFMKPLNLSFHSCFYMYYLLGFNVNKRIGAKRQTLLSVHDSRIHLLSTMFLHTPFYSFCTTSNIQLASVRAIEECTKLKRIIKYHILHRDFLFF